MSKPMNKGEKISAAMERAEDAMSDLIQAAEQYGREIAGGAASLWDQRCHRRDLLRTARRYARAMQRITQIRA